MHGCANPACQAIAEFQRVPKNLSSGIVDRGSLISLHPTPETIHESDGLEIINQIKIDKAVASYLIGDIRSVDIEKSDCLYAQRPLVGNAPAQFEN